MARAACGGIAGARAKARRSDSEAVSAPSALQEDARATEASNYSRKIENLIHPIPLARSTEPVAAAHDSRHREA